MSCSAELSMKNSFISSGPELNQAICYTGISLIDLYVKVLNLFSYYSETIRPDMLGRLFI